MNMRRQILNVILALEASEVAVGMVCCDCEVECHVLTSSTRLFHPAESRV